MYSFTFFVATSYRNIFCLTLCMHQKIIISQGVRAIEKYNFSNQLVISVSCTIHLHRTMSEVYTLDLVIEVLYHNYIDYMYILIVIYV